MTSKKHLGNVKITGTNSWTGVCERQSPCSFTPWQWHYKCSSCAEFYLITFLINRKKASRAEEQKFFPYIEIWGHESNRTINVNAFLLSVSLFLDKQVQHWLSHLNKLNYPHWKYMLLYGSYNIYSIKLCNACTLKKWSDSP